MQLFINHEPEQPDLRDQGNIHVGGDQSLTQNPIYQDVFSWSDSGKYVEIRDEEKMEADVLQREFKHNKMESFVRQVGLGLFS